MTDSITHAAPSFFVYILAGPRRHIFFTGLTNDINRSMLEHKNELADEYSKHYGLNRLVYFEAFEDMQEAMRRHRQVRKWRGSVKRVMIKKVNPDWHDLYFELRKERIEAAA